jgi:hypothetical protein
VAVAARPQRRHLLDLEYLPCDLIHSAPRLRRARLQRERGRTVITREKALACHTEGWPGKPKVTPTEPRRSSRGVARWCRRSSATPAATSSEK